MKYIFSVFFIFLSVLALSQTQNKNGNWNNSGNWQGGNIGDDISESVTLANNVSSTIVNGDNYTIGDLTFGNGATLTINTGGILIIGSAGDLGFLETNNNANIIIDGTLEIFGDLDVNNNLDIEVTGDLIIRGDVNLNNNAELEISGSMVVDGDFNANNGTDFIVDGSVDIGGDINVGSGDLDLLPGGSFTVGGTCSWTTEICDTILPVDLISVTARPIGQIVVVSWSTALEKDNDYFEVEISSDGKEFRKLVQIDGAGNSSEKKEYSFRDEYPLPGKSYYRLIQTDFNGDRTIYTPVQVDRGFSGDIGIYPNPVEREGTLHLYTGGTLDDNVSIRLYSINGNVLWENDFKGNHSEITLPPSLGRGTYLLEIRTGNQRKLHHLVLK